MASAAEAQIDAHRPGAALRPRGGSRVSPQLARGRRLARQAVLCSLKLSQRVPAPYAERVDRLSDALLAGYTRFVRATQRGESAAGAELAAANRHLLEAAAALGPMLVGRPIARRRLGPIHGLLQQLVILSDQLCQAQKR